MKPFRFPYAIAAEFWLFGPPAKKQTAIHLFIMMALFGSGTVAFAILEDRIGRLLSVLAAIPVGLMDMVSIGCSPKAFRHYIG